MVLLRTVSVWIIYTDNGGIGHLRANDEMALVMIVLILTVNAKGVNS